MKLVIYIKEKLAFIFSMVFIIIAIYVMGYACKIRRDYMNVLALIIVILSVFQLLTEYLRKKKFYNEMYNILEGLDQKYLLTEMKLNPNFAEGEILMDVMYEVDRSMKERLNEIEQSYVEFKEYLEMWIHQIKIPISAIKLMNYNGNIDVAKQLVQINRMNDYVEQILYYARADAPEKDYILKKCNLESIINNVLLQQKELLLGNRIKIQKNNTDKDVVTDGKWITFMLGQIINNSVKYMDKNKESYISFEVVEAKDKTILTIKDNGIGITIKDVPRVFERSFTGENGRKNNVSTGMGLYICKRLCNKLGHEIDISSVDGEGTSVSISFGKNDYYLK